MSSMRDRVRQRAEEKGRESTGNSVVKLPEGAKFFEMKKDRNIVDIVPYIVNAINHPYAKRGEMFYERTYYVHRGIGAEGRTILCPLKTFKRPCPICQKRAGLLDDYDRNKEVIKDLKPSERQLYNLDTPRGIEVLDYSHYLFGEKLEKELRDDSRYETFAELKGGYTLRVRCTEEKLGTNSYLEVDRIDFDPRQDYTEAILKETIDLDACLIELSYKEIENIFLELEEPDSYDERGPAGSSRPGDVGESEAGYERRRRDIPEESERQREVPAQERQRERQQEAAPAQERQRERQREEPTQERQRERQREEPTQERQRERQQEAAPAQETKQTSPTGACPAGGTWGVSCDKLEECYKCTVWEGCRDEKDRLR